MSLENFAFAREQLDQYIQQLPNEALLAAHPLVESLARQFRHVADIAELYAKALESGVVDFSHKREDRAMQNTPTLLRQHFLAQRAWVADRIAAVAGNPWNTASITFPDMEALTPAQLVGILAQHEALHLGIIWTVARSLGHEVPDPY